MNPSTASLQETLTTVLETLPLVWDRIRSNLRTAATAKFGITLEQFHILRHIRRGCRSVGALAEKKQISNSAVSQAIEALVEKGLVTRRQEIDDRRCVLLELTNHANEVLDANYEENRSWMELKMASLTGEELNSIQRAMEILKETFTPGEA